MNFPRELPSSYSSAAVTPSSVTKTSHGDVNSLLHHSLQRQIILYSSYFVFCKKEETINYSLADRLAECESNGNDCWLAAQEFNHCICSLPLQVAISTPPTRVISSSLYAYRIVPGNEERMDTTRQHLNQ